MYIYMHIHQEIQNIFPFPKIGFEKQRLGAQIVVNGLSGERLHNRAKPFRVAFNFGFLLFDRILLSGAEILELLDSLPVFVFDSTDLRFHRFIQGLYIMERLHERLEFVC